MTATAITSASAASASVNGIAATVGEYEKFNEGMTSVTKNYRENSGKLWLNVKRAVNLYLLDSDSRGFSRIASELAKAKEDGQRDLAQALEQGCATVRAIAFGRLDILKNGQHRYYIPEEHAKCSLAFAADHIGAEAWRAGRDAFKALYQIKVTVEHETKTLDEKLAKIASQAAKLLASEDDDTVAQFLDTIRAAVMENRSKKAAIEELKAQLKKLQNA